MKTLFRALVVCLICTAASAATAPDQSRLSNVAMLAFSGKHEHARLQIEEALTVYRAEKNPFGEGVSLVLLGIVDVAAKRPAAARPNFEQGAAVLQGAGDFVTSFLALYMLAELDTSEGNLESSIQRHVRALEALQSASAPGAPFKLDGLIVLGPAVGIDVSMLSMLQSSAEIMKPIMLSFFEGMIRDSYGKVLTAAGKFPEAEEQLRRALEAGKMFGVFNQSIESHLGDLRRRQWRFDEAQEHYKNALQRIVPLPMIPQRDEWITVRSLGHLAEIEQLRGRIDEALAWNDQARAITRESQNRKREVSVLESRGDLLLGVSRFDDAEKTLLEALALAESIGEVYQQATVTSSLGIVYLLRGDFGRAASTLEKSVALFGKTDADVVQSSTLLALAEVYIALGAHDSARDTLKKGQLLANKENFPLADKFADLLFSAIDATERKDEQSRAKLDESFSKWWELPEMDELLLPKELRALLRDMMGLEPVLTATPSSAAEELRLSQLAPMVAMRRLIEGKRLMARGDFPGARAVWQKALEENKTKEFVAPFLAGVGATYWREGKMEDAVRKFDEAVRALGLPIQDVKVEEFLAGYLGSERRWFFDMAIRSLVIQRRYADAFDHAERARARAFLHSIANARLQPTRGADPTLVNQAEALRKRIAAWQQQSAFQSAEMAEDLRHAREEYQSILKRVKASNPEYASLTTIEPLGIEEVQRELPSEATLISYFLGAGSVHAWIVDRDTLRYVPLRITDDQLKKIGCWARYLDGGVVRSMNPDDPGCLEALSAEEAYRLLIEPLREYLRHPRLIVVPHGVLHYVPFAALRDPEARRYLLEDYTITYVPSASAWRFLREKETPVNGNALVLGDPAAVSNRPLAGAQREAAAIARALGTTARLGEQATESTLYHLDGKFDVVHIAAHAMYDARTPLFSYVALAKDGQEDGRLEVNDILSSVDFRGVNLVVLSACGTARGARSGGDEIVGLTRAVLYAGAPGVISTLWDVDDDATADLMSEMYERIRRGASVADALRGAQLALMKRAPYADPQYWAAFELSGDPQGRWTAVN